MSEPKFFVVRRFHDKEHHCFEIGDKSDRYTREDKKAIVYRAQMPAGDPMTLDQVIAAYKAGARMKPPPRLALVPKPKDRNSVRERYLAKLRAEQSAASDWPEG